MVALKVLPLAATLDPRALQRFHLEAQVAGLLQHPRIVPVHAVGMVDDVPYYAMQYIEGGSLADLIIALRHLNSGLALSSTRSENARQGEAPSEPSARRRLGRSLAFPERPSCSQQAGQSRGRPAVRPLDRSSARCHGVRDRRPAPASRGPAVDPQSFVYPRHRPAGHRGGRGGGPCPRPGDRASRHQAGEHPLEPERASSGSPISAWPTCRAVTA